MNLLLALPLNRTGIDSSEKDGRLFLEVEERGANKRVKIPPSWAAAHFRPSDVENHSHCRFLRIRNPGGLRQVSS